MEPTNKQTSFLVEQRRTVAHKVSQRFQPNAEVTAIVVFGSVATGYVDEHSDVDMLVICNNKAITLDKRQAILDPFGTEWHYDSPIDNSLFAHQDEDGRIDGVLVTVHYQLVDWIDAVVNEVLQQGAVTTTRLPFRPYTLLALLQRAWVLEDKDGWIAEWQERAKCYPTQLQSNVVAYFAPILREQTEDLVLSAERDIGPSVFLFHLNRAVDALTSILYAINNVYDPADRRAERTVLPHLATAPAGFCNRLTNVLEGPFDRQGILGCAREFAKLSEEVLKMATQLHV